MFYNFSFMVHTSASNSAISSSVKSQLGSTCHQCKLILDFHCYQTSCQDSRTSTSIGAMSCNVSAEASASLSRSALLRPFASGEDGLSLRLLLGRSELPALNRSASSSVNQSVRSGGMSVISAPVLARTFVAYVLRQLLILKSRNLKHENVTYVCPLVTCLPYMCLDVPKLHLVMIAALI